MSEASGAGRKYDQGKSRWSLLPLVSIQAILDVLEYGAKKYEPDNWKKLDNYRERYFDAAMRHLIAWRGGESNDPESGLPHLAHVGCNVVFLLWFEDRDDTPCVDPEPGFDAWFKEWSTLMIPPPSPRMIWRKLPERFRKYWECVETLGKDHPTTIRIDAQLQREREE